MTLRMSAWRSKTWCWNPIVALTRVEPDTRNPGKHVLELFTLEPVLSDTECRTSYVHQHRDSI